MTVIDGWAFRSNELEIRDQRLARYNEVKNMGVKITSAIPQYAQTTYKGEIPEGAEHLSDMDIALICDKGNTCFGGSVSRNGRTFGCTIYTD